MPTPRAFGLLAASVFALAPFVVGHGGSYVPPPSGGAVPGPPAPPSTPGGAAPPAPGGGHYGGPGDTTPGGPSGGGGSGPASPGPSAPGAPGPSRPSSPPPSAPGPAAGPSAASTLPSSSVDVGEWHSWWWVNQHEFLRLKDAVWSGVLATEEFGFDLGAGQRSAGGTPRRPSPELIVERVLPALLAALEGQRQPDVLSGCLTALAKLGALPADQPELELRRRAAIESYLNHPHQELSETAVLCLGLLGEPDQLAVLASVAMDDARGRELVSSASVASRTRAFAAYGLGVLAERDPHPDVQRYCAHALTELLAADDTGSPDLSVACVSALSLVRLPELSGDGEEGPASSSRAALVSALLERLGDRRTDDVVRGHLPRALARAVGSDPSELRTLVVDELLGLLARGERLDAVTRVGCAQALGMLGTAGDDKLDARLRAGLSQAVTRGDLVTRHHALIALAEVASRPGVGSEDPWVGARAVKALLLEQLARGKSRTRPWAALALGVQGFYLREQDLSPSSDVSLALRSSLEECRSPLDMGAYALALGLRGDVGAAELVRAKLEGVQDDAARGQLAVALGLMRDQASAGRLRELLPEARYRAPLLRSLAIGLALLGDPGVVDSLVVKLEECQSSALQAAYAGALAYVGDVRAVEPLIALLADPDVPDLTRGMAALGLGWTCEAVRLPWNTRLARDANLVRAPATLFDPSGGAGVLDIR